MYTNVIVNGINHNTYSFKLEDEFMDVELINVGGYFKVHTMDELKSAVRSTLEEIIKKRGKDIVT